MKVAKGITRIVFLIGSIAIKFPNPFNGWHNFIMGIAGNICEDANWYGVSCTIETDPQYPCRQLLCPVLWSSWGCWLVVMRRADRVLTEQESENLDLTPWEEQNLEGDDKPNNYGWLNGRIVKIDYGHFCFIVRWWHKEDEIVESE